jgi:hypothetical protein
MKIMMTTSAVLCLLFSGSGIARADVLVDVSGSVAVTPAVPVPVYVPAAPPVAPPLAPFQVRAVAPVPRVAATVGGQWVYTGQYGWVYIPYGDQYVYTHTAGAYAYVYYPRFGWRWLAAPWTVGSGPHPYFGAHGPFAYGWYRGLHRARHPWAVHYANAHGGPAHGRPWVGRAAAPAAARRVARPVGARVPARAMVPHSVRATAPARPTPRPGVVAQRNPAGPARGAGPSRGGGRGRR